MESMTSRMRKIENKDIEEIQSNRAVDLLAKNKQQAERIKELETELAFNKEVAAKSYTACGNYQKRIAGLESENKAVTKRAGAAEEDWQTAEKRITWLEDEIQEAANDLYDLYDKCNNTTEPEVYGAILGLHERLELALKGS